MRTQLNSLRRNGVDKTASDKNAVREVDENETKGFQPYVKERTQFYPETESQQELDREAE